MQRHALIGASMLCESRSPVMQLAETIARMHHERWDGAGYPNGLSGTDIPLAGRICGICDVFDALVSERPYKQDGPSAKRSTRSARRADSTSTRTSLRRSSTSRRMPSPSSTTQDTRAAERRPRA
jgi:hypothetical protein